MLKYFDCVVIIRVRLQVTKMLKSDETRFPEAIELITEIESGIVNGVNKSFIKKLRKLGKMFGEKKPQIEVEGYCLFEWWVIEYKNKPYLCGNSCAGCGNASIIIDYKLNVLRNFFYGNLHRDTAEEYKSTLEWIDRYE
jgi:hypothetical protein